MIATLELMAKRLLIGYRFGRAELPRYFEVGRALQLANRLKLQADSVLD